ncbi:MAG: O-antigen ligase family protein [Prevotellaceae bacterium]|jgi:O-antigen ligase|nr:O-antigen ligase family protein [Prevotellaceae bacterium]
MNKTDLYYSFVKLSIQFIAALGMLVVALVMAFPAKTMNPVFVGWLIVCGLDMLVSYKEFSFPKPSKKNITLFIIMALYFYMVVSLLWTDNFKEAGNLLAKRITFLVLPFYALVNRNKFINFRLVMLFFIVGTVGSILFDTFLAWKTAGTNFVEFKYEFIDKYHHRTYFSIAICTAFSFFIYLYHDLTNVISKKLYYSLFIALSILFFATIWFLEGRICLIAFFLILIGVFMVKFRNYIRLVIPTAVLILIAVFFVLKNHPRMENFDFSKEQLIQFDPRGELWLNAVHCIEQENKIIGVGIGDTEDVFVENYANEKYNQYALVIATTHNQFLHTQLELGAIGLLLFLALLLSIFISTKGIKNKLLVFNLFTLWFLSSLTECNDIKYVPIYIFAFSLIIIYLSKNDKRKELGLKMDFSEVDKLQN